MANKTIGSIPYSLSARLSKPNDKNSEKKVYATLQTNETVDKVLLARHMREHGSSLSQGTLEGVVTDLGGCIAEMLLAGHSVNLHPLGKFHLTASCEGADSADEFSPSAITLNVRFTPDQELVAEVNTRAEFTQQATRELQAQARKDARQAADETIGGNSGSGSGSGNNGGQADPSDVTP